MNRIALLTISALFLGGILVCSCGGRNRYFESMKKISEQIRLQPNDQSKWQELVDLSKSDDMWSRHYAYCFLSELVSDKVGDQAGVCIPLFIAGTHDPEQMNRHRCVVAIGDLGAEAVNQASARLLEIVREGKEDDVTWSAAEALGKISRGEIASAAVKELLHIATQPVRLDLDPGAPQLRLFALESAKILFIAHLRDPENAKLFDPLLSGADPSFRTAVEAAIKEVRAAVGN